MAVCFGGDRESLTYFPALSALRLAALGSTTALNLAPAGVDEWPLPESRGSTAKSWTAADLNKARVRQLSCTILR